MKLIFATNNKHKVEEIRAVLPPDLSIISLKEAGIDVDIPEPYETLRENAASKARTIFRMSRTDCFSEDTGLEVYSINDEPGVHSARYAGDERNADKNIAKLLFKLASINDRRARFHTVICLLLDEKEYYFEGICEGKISRLPAGLGGFGYDAVFIPEGSDKTFAEMNMEDKNRFSHRKKATDMLVAFLSTLQINKKN